MTTIKDVARLSGVSVATVSHVMNNSRAVGADARERVLKAIKTLNYRRDGVARSLRRNQTGTIAVLISDITNPFFADLVRGVEHEARRQRENYNILLCNTEENAERERQALDLVLEKRIDGIVMAAAGGNEAYISEMVMGRVPIVFADRAAAGIAADTVLVNNREAAAKLVGHLASLGHKRIAALRAELNASSIDERIAGYSEALARAKLPLEPDLIIDAPSSIEAARNAAATLIARRKRPTAIFCTNNFMTLGAVQALLEAQLSCPEDVAVVGFDDFPWASAFSPRLTVIAQPAERMGEEAARLLFDRIEKRRTGAPIRVVLDATMIVRESCGVRLVKAASAA
jgi:LacI family transcriptional regulator, galactose operon repressor